MLQPQSDTGTTADTGTMGLGEVSVEVEGEVANPFLPGTVVSRDAAWMVELWRAGNLHQYGSCSHQVTRQQRGLSTFKYYGAAVCYPNQLHLRYLYCVYCILY